MVEEEAEGGGEEEGGELSGVSFEDTPIRVPHNLTFP